MRWFPGTLSIYTTARCKPWKLAKLDPNPMAQNSPKALYSMVVGGPKAFKCQSLESKGKLYSTTYPQSERGSSQRQGARNCLNPSEDSKGGMKAGSMKDPLYKDP